MMFYANSEGVAKSLEFSCPNLCEAVDYVVADPKGRDVDVWQDGEFVFSIRRKPLAAEPEFLPAHQI